MLNGGYVGCVRVSFLDTSTLAGRSGYFDSVGITRDILQVGHLTPTSFASCLFPRLTTYLLIYPPIYSPTYLPSHSPPSLPTTTYLTP